MGRRKKNALRLLPNLSGNKSRIHYLVRLYKFNQKTTPIEPILVVGEYHFDSGRFGFDFGAFSAIFSITAPCRMGEPAWMRTGPTIR